jgi:long-chain fatty acid transport protein
MIRTWKLWLILFFLILGIPGLAGAAGYGIYEWGARGQGLGGAMTARGEDPSTVVYNPAAMTQLPGTHVSAGMTFIRPSGTVEPDDSSLHGGEGEDNTWIIPNAYLTTQLGERYWFGMGLYSRTGLGTEYDDDENWFGRYNSMYAGIKQISLTPNLAIKLTDSLSMGVGLEVAYIEVNLQTMIDAADPKNPGTGGGFFDVKQKLKGGDPGYGFNLALHYKPIDWLSFGASYRSKIEVTMKGDADFSNIGSLAVAGDAAKTLGQAYGDSFKATEPLPAMLSLGVMVKPLDKLSVSFDLLRTYWSAYNELKIEMTNSVLPSPADTIVKKKNWKDVNRYQIGLEYALYDWMDLRLGYVYDESPVDPDHAEYQIPSNDRQIYSIGSGFHWDAWTIDVAYSYLTVKERNFKDSKERGVNTASTFEDGDSHIVALNLGYRF